MTPVYKFSFFPASAKPQIQVHEPWEISALYFYYCFFVFTDCREIKGASLDPCENCVQLWAPDLQKLFLYMCVCLCHVGEISYFLISICRILYI